MSGGMLPRFHAPQGAAYAALMLFWVGSPALAEIVSLDSTLTESLKSSFDMKLANVHALQTRSDIRAARADYFPTLQAVASSEYDKGLKNSTQSVFSVGNTTFNAITRFQEMAALQSYWTLYDFGARANTLLAAKRSFSAAKMASNSTARDLKLTVIDVYTQVLSTYKTLKAKEQSVAVYRELFDIKKRTYQAGNISRVELGEQSLQLAQAEDGVRELKEVMTERLKELSNYTHRSYSIDDLQMVDFDALTAIPSLPFKAESTPDYLQYQKQIEAKRAELRALFAQKFPTIRAYSGYVFYGTNANSLGNAIGAFSNRLLDVGVTMQWTAFDGFKNAAQRERKKYEIEELQIQRDKKLWDLQNQYDKASAILSPLAAQLTTKAEIINRGEEKVSMYERLAERKVTDRTQLLVQRAQLIDQQLAADKVRIQKAASIEKLRVLAGG